MEQSPFRGLYRVDPPGVTRPDIPIESAYVGEQDDYNLRLKREALNVAGGACLATVGGAWGAGKPYKGQAISGSKSIVGGNVVGGSDYLYGYLNCGDYC